jgi:hypothetical protein
VTTDASTYVHDFYEVVKSFGFEVDTEDKTGAYRRIAFRCDVVQLHGAQDFTTVLWQVHGEMGNLLNQVMRVGEAGSCPTVDEVVERVLRLAKESGVRQPTGSV